MIINKTLTLNDRDLQYTVSERKDSNPYISGSGVVVSDAILAPFTFTYRTSTKQSKFTFTLTAGVWASQTIFEDWLSGGDGRNRPIDLYDMVFTSDGVPLRKEDGSVVYICTLNDVEKWLLISDSHLGGFEITAEGYGPNGLLTLIDPINGLPLSNNWG